MRRPNVTRFKLAREVVQNRGYKERCAWAVKATLGLSLFAGSASFCFAAYTIQNNVETLAGTNRYTWTVHNQDQSWGLDMFAVEVPVQTRVLGYTVPPPYSNPDGTAYWIMEERRLAWIDPHDGSVVIPAPQAGRKWLLWLGLQSPSVYPPGTTATFSLMTDSAVAPCAARASAVTYTPQNNPHYYLAWPTQITGPGISPVPLSPLIVNPNNGHSYLLLGSSGWTCSESEAQRRGGHLVTIRSQSEQDWVYQTFSRYGGVSRLLWTGLNDAASEGRFVWSSGEPVTFTGWAAGEPNNAVGGEDYVAMFYPGHDAASRWNDWSDRSVDPIGVPFNGVVEIIPPNLVITSPTNGTIFAGATNVSIQLNLTGQTSIVREVRLFLQSTLIGTATNSPFNFLSPPLTDGDYCLRAEAIGAGGTIISSSPTICISVTNPLVKRYTLLDLGVLADSRDSRATSINNSGVVVGYSLLVNSYRAFVYSNDLVEYLDLLSERSGGGGSAAATAINDAGQITGYSTTSNSYDHAFLYDNGKLMDLGTLGSIRSYGLGINNYGVTVGNSALTNLLSRGFVFSNGVMQALGTLGGPGSGAFAINDFNQIVGDAETTNGTTHAFLYDPTQGMKDLGAFGTVYPDSFARGINNASQVVGYALHPASPMDGRAFLYDGAMKNLGTLGGRGSAANAINNHAQLVGTATDYDNEPHAFLWQDGLMYDLNHLIPSSSGWRLQEALDINDCGQIVGYGNLAGSDDRHAFLLTPTPNLPPLVAITSPTNGAVFRANDMIVVESFAQDDGCIREVTFLVNAALVPTSSQASSSTILSNLSAGTYNISARAVDNGGVASTSAPVTITVLSVNHAPVAVVTVFPLFQISPNETDFVVLSLNNTNAVVFFDGSHSYDLENNPLQFFWFEKGAANPFATGIVASEVLDVGSHSIVLIVSDGMDTSTNLIVVDVVTAAQALQKLGDLIDHSHLSANDAHPLIVTLNAASASFVRGNPRSGLNQLKAFQNKVRAQIRADDAALVESVIQAVQKIIDAFVGSNN